MDEAQCVTFVSIAAGAVWMQHNEGLLDSYTQIKDQINVNKQNTGKEMWKEKELLSFPMGR